MRTLVVGDVHGCKDEFVDLLKVAKADRVVLVGDLFTKGPKPAGVYKCIRKHNSEAVLGNHDQRLIDALDGNRPSDAAAHRCIARLNKTGIEWQDWLRALPLFLDVGGFTVVHAGLHPSGRKKRTSRTTALYRRRWPEDKPGNPHWHDVYWGKRRVIFGHDAVGGLVRVERDGQPQLIGLDTGCVYGGALTGYLVEQDKLIQVQAQRVYQAVKRHSQA